MSTQPPVAPPLTHTASTTTTKRGPGRPRKEPSIEPTELNLNDIVKQRDKLKKTNLTTAADGPARTTRTTSKLSSQDHEQPNQRNELKLKWNTHWEKVWNEQVVTQLKSDSTLEDLLSRYSTANSQAQQLAAMTTLIVNLKALNELLKKQKHDDFESFTATITFKDKEIQAYKDEIEQLKRQVHASNPGMMNSFFSVFRGSSGSGSDAGGDTSNTNNSGTTAELEVHIEKLKKQIDEFEKSKATLKAEKAALKTKLTERDNATWETFRAFAQMINRVIGPNLISNDSKSSCMKDTQTILKDILNQNEVNGWKLIRTAPLTPVQTPSSQPVPDMLSIEPAAPESNQVLPIFLFTLLSVTSKYT